MTDSMIALTIVGMMGVTFGVRYGVLRVVSRIPLPVPMFRALRYVPPAVLAAIVAPTVLMPNGALDVRFSNAYLAGAIAAILVGWRAKSLLLTIAAGMLVMWLWKALFTA